MFPEAFLQKKKSLATESGLDSTCLKQDQEFEGNQVKGQADFYNVTKITTKQLLLLKFGEYLPVSEPVATFSTTESLTCGSFSYRT